MEYSASLELLKVYDTIIDRDAESKGLIRVIDESGEDYLYPRELFVSFDVPEPVQAVLANEGATQERKRRR